MDIVKQINELEDKGINIIDALAGDVKYPAAEKLFVDELKGSAGDELYSDVLFTITFKRFNKDEAKKLFSEIIKHKYYMSEKLKRNVGVRIAALDYLANDKKILKNVRLIDENQMEQFMVFMNYDAATGVFNHRYFHEQLEEALCLAMNFSNPLSLLMMDVDNFKEYNDALGHLKGDVALRQIALMMKENTSETDIVARYGGDEFVIILPGRTKQKALEIAEKIRKRIDDFHFYHQEATVGKKVSLSIGVSAFPEDASERLKLIGKADEAMYEAKKAGKNAVRSAS